MLQGDKCGIDNGSILIKGGGMKWITEVKVLSKGGEVEYSGTPLKEHP